MPTRLAPLIACSFVAVALMPLGMPTAAAVVTCQGQQATLVGTGSVVVGTPDDDVIVSNGSRVDAGDGADVICLTGGARQHTAGSGDDAVLVQTVGHRIDLGAGADTFTGSSGPDTLTLSVDTDVDRIATGPGNDRVGLDSVASDPDQVDLGPGDDSLFQDGVDTAPTAAVVGGSGTDEISFSGEGGPRWSVDNVTERATDGTHTLAFDGFESFGFFFRGSVENNFRGGNGDEVVNAFGFPAELRNVSMGGGDDYVYGGAPNGTAGVWDGGPGDDGVLQYGGDALTYATSGRITDPVGRSVTLLRSVESPSLWADEVTAVGGPRPAVLQAYTCELRFRGGSGPEYVIHEQQADSMTDYCGPYRSEVDLGGGDDRFGSSTTSRDRVRGGPGNDRVDTRTGDDRVLGEQGRDVVDLGAGNDVGDGGPGRDVLQGRAGKDRLAGGGGRDKVVAGPGRDRCRSAERTVSCER